MAFQHSQLGKAIFITTTSAKIRVVQVSGVESSTSHNPDIISAAYQTVQAQAQGSAASGDCSRHTDKRDPYRR